VKNTIRKIDNNVRNVMKLKQKQKKNKKKPSYQLPVRPNLAQLKRRCLQKEMQIAQDLIERGATEISGKCRTSWWKSGDKKGDFTNSCYYLNNNSNVLAVAHMDTVQSCKHFDSAKLTNETRVFNAKLDDRLGVYTIMDFLPALGISTDILLTTDEERCATSAKHFSPNVANKGWNWIVEFDREGVDVVLYQYHDAVWEEAIVESGFTLGHGSYSDIAELDEHGVCAMNIGVGTQHGHSADAYTVLEDYTSQIAKFLNFYHINVDKEFKFTDTGYSYGFSDEYYPLGRRGI